MSTAVLERPAQPAGPATGDGGAPARRAVVRWAWRLFRREWRRQMLVLALLAVAVAATTIGLAVVSNASQLGDDPTFGTANSIITVVSDRNLSADVAAVQSRFGKVDVVAHQNIAVPGSVSSIDLRDESPTGVYVHVTMRLDAGRYPSGHDQVAVTRSVATDFDLHVGGVWQEGSRTLQVVGLVENPLSLQDQFALVAPGQVNSPDNVSILVNAPGHGFDSFRLPSGAGIDVASRGTTGKVAAEALVLVMATIGLLFVGLLAVAGFAVMAQRRLRALGMLHSLGATDRHVRLVMLANGAAVGACAAVAGTAAGLGGWLAFAPRLGSIIGRRVDRFNLPWWAIGVDMVLAFVTAVAAAWWPARAVARIPVVAALSGRPPRPQPAHRFAALGGLVLGAGLVLLAFAHQRRAGFIISGTIATTIGLLLLAPLTISAVAAIGGRASISVRLALRDLARYQARSGAALGAATLAIGIAATIAISAAAAQAPATVGNLPSNQLHLYLGAGGTGPGNPIPVLTPGQQKLLQTRVDQLASTLGAQAVVPLEAAVNPDAPVQPAQPGSGPSGQSGGQDTASMARVTRTGRGEEVNSVASISVATAALLSHYGIKPSQIDPSADVITAAGTNLGGLQIFLPFFGPDPSSGTTPPVRQPPQPTGVAHPKIQTIKQLPIYGSDPNTLITSRAMQALGLQALPAGWLIQTLNPLTTAQIHTAQKLAASAGLSVEAKSAQQSTAALRNWSTIAGILVALGVLAMTVGLIRSETANDLRTLTATGASSVVRRTLTGATAGALALLGALLGAGGAYAALLAWHRSNLHPLTNVPILNLTVIIVGLPAIATAGGWLLAGREPSALARRPLE